MHERDHHLEGAPLGIAEEDLRLVEVADLLRLLRHRLEFIDDLTPLAAEPGAWGDAETVVAILECGLLNP